MKITHVINTTTVILACHHRFSTSDNTDVSVGNNFTCIYCDDPDMIVEADHDDAAVSDTPKGGK